jgi:mutator family transposase
MGPQRCAVRCWDVFDRPVLGRCQLHKIRNVADHLPEKLRTLVTSRMRRAYHADSALAAEAELGAELDRTQPGAAASLREGMAETLTVLRLNVPPTPGSVTPIDERHREHDLDPPHTRTTSRTGVTARWRCAGAPRA